MVLNTVVGESVPRSSGLSGKSAWACNTPNPNRNITVLKSSRAITYCFQFCGPVSKRRSTQRSQPGAEYRPSRIHAKYQPIGIDSTKVVPTIRIGSNHTCHIGDILSG